MPPAPPGASRRNTSTASVKSITRAPSTQSRKWTCSAKKKLYRVFKGCFPTTKSWPKNPEQPQALLPHAGSLIPWMAPSTMHMVIHAIACPSRSKSTAEWKSVSFTIRASMSCSLLKKARGDLEWRSHPRVKDRQSDPQSACDGFRLRCCKNRSYQSGSFREFSSVMPGSAPPGLCRHGPCVCCLWPLRGFWELKLHPWDYAAGWLLVTEAGGTVTRFDGAPFQMGDREILATNQQIHQPMVDVLMTGSSRGIE